ncbi:MAG: MotA/TolQ/ExbB proton channel family protein [Methylococcales bacterium]|nr:MotA/TolQ/ExbB proton channel family protein [Methylococcales bacterium]
MKKLILTLLLTFTIQPLFAEHLDLTQLLREAQKIQGMEGKINQERETRFSADNSKQQALLNTAQQTFKDHSKITNELKATVKNNENELALLQTLLKENSGDLTDLFTVAKQVAGDLKVNLDSSLISAQFPQRSLLLNKISKSKKIPTIDQLEALWITLQQEMTESGKIVYFTTEVLNSAGTPEQNKVIRVGNFNAFSKGQYLRYLPETGKLVTLPRQPQGDYLSMAENMDSVNTGQVDIGIDPTRGVILSMLIQAPDTIQRIKQGGVIGYIILVMGGLGFIYALVRLTMLSLTAKKINEQIEQEKANDDNPLGRVFIATQNDNQADGDNLELLLDEAITREIPALEKGLPMIKLLAAVAPLLGLLGTVTGMIATFQAISLFGTGDPKLMANGISQALVTTMLGLCIAIPLLFLHSIVAARSRTLIQILDEQTAGILSRRLEK